MRLAAMMFTALGVLGFSALPLACSGSNGTGLETGCAGLSSCCATLTGTDAQGCLATAAQSGVTDVECSEALSAYQSAGQCAALGAPEAGVGTATGCAALATCCQSLPASEVPTECVEVAQNGTTEACTASLGAYEAAGYCGGGIACLLAKVGAGCGPCLSAKCASQVSAFSTECSSVIACTCNQDGSGGPGESCSTSATSSCSSAEVAFTSCTASGCSDECESEAGSVPVDPAGDGGARLVVEAGSSGDETVACVEKSGECVEAVIPAAAVQSIQQSCTSQGGALVTACSTAGLSGCCRRVSDSVTTTDCYYEQTPSELSEDKSECASDGVWSTTP